MNSRQEKPYKSTLSFTERQTVDSLENLLNNTIPQEKERSEQAAFDLREMRLTYLPETVKTYERIGPATRTIARNSGESDTTKFRYQIAALRAQAQAHIIALEKPASDALAINGAFLKRRLSPEAWDNSRVQKQNASVATEEDKPEKFPSVIWTTQDEANTIDIKCMISNDFFDKGTEITSNVKTYFIRKTPIGRQYILQKIDNNLILTLNESRGRTGCNTENRAEVMNFFKIGGLVVGGTSLMSYYLVHDIIWTAGMACFGVVIAYVLEMAAMRKMKEAASLAWKIAHLMPGTLQGQKRSKKQADLMAHPSFNRMVLEFQAMIKRDILESIMYARKTHELEDSAGVF